MESLFQYVAPPSPCGYLPEETWRLEYDHVAEVTSAEYLERMRQGWRRFGHVLFRPRCPACNACRSLRVPVADFRPDRSQRRVRKANDGVIRVQIGTPRVNRARLSLYDRYHAHQAEVKGWPVHPAKDADGYAESFVDNPFPTQEWCYYLGDRLVGVGYVDDLPGALSAIYFFYDPSERQRSLGTWNVLSILDHAARRGLAHVYLGYYVEGCASMVYKSRFAPNEILWPDGTWRPFQPVRRHGV
jgi:arginine-tRNA-protein transferase